MPLASRPARLGLVLLLAAAPLLAPPAATRLAAQEAPVRPAAGGFLIDFHEQDLRVVLSALAEAGGLNVTFSNLPNRRTTLRMGQPVPREEIIDVIRGIVESNGLRMTEEGSLIRIEPALSLAQQRAAQIAQPSQMQLFTYRLKHASAVQVAPVLMSLFSGIPVVRGATGIALPPQPGSFQVRPQQPRGDVEVPAGQVPPGNVIVRPPADVTSARTGIGQREAVRVEQASAAMSAALDRMPPEARERMEAMLGEAIVMRNEAMQQQALTLSSSAGEVRIVPEENTNSLLVRATTQDWLLIQQLLQTIDLRPLQVLIEVTIVEVRRSSDLSVGVSGVATRTRPGETVEQATAKLPSVATARDFVLQLTGGRGTIDFDVALNALASRGELRVLSLPILIAQNNKQAVLNVGQNRPFIQVSQSVPNDPLGRIETIQYLPVGTTLTIVPTINPDGYVNLQVQQTANSATNEVQFDAPVLSTREATTQVFVRDGQTTVIGGLADNTKDRTRSGIPILSSIPGLGWLFGNTVQNDVTSELFLFLTPHVVSGDEDIDRLREAVRDGSILLKQVPTDPLIPPAATTDTIPLPPRRPPTPPDSAVPAAPAPTRPPPGEETAEEPRMYADARGAIRHTPRSLSPEPVTEGRARSRPGDARSVGSVQIRGVPPRRSSGTDGVTPRASAYLRGSSPSAPSLATMPPRCDTACRQTTS